MFSCWPIQACTEPISALIPEDPDRLEFDLSTIVGPGWRASETGATGITFRWMTAPRASIPLQLQDEGSYQIEFLVRVSLTSEMLDSVQLYLNDVSIDISYTITEQGVLYRGVIPPGTVNLREIDDLEFRVPHLDTVPDTDVQLGIAVDWVMFDRSPGT